MEVMILLKPRMIEQVGYFDSRLRILVQHLGENINDEIVVCVILHGRCRKRHGILLDHPKELNGGVCHERTPAIDKNVKRHASRPDINGKRIIPIPSHDLRSKKGSRAGCAVKDGIDGLHDLCRTEIADFDAIVMGEKKIFRFQVTMDDPVGVNMMQSKNEIECVSTKDRFWERSGFQFALKDGSARKKLHNDLNIIAVIVTDHINQLHDVVTALKSMENLDLSLGMILVVCSQTSISLSNQLL